MHGLKPVFASMPVDPGPACALLLLDVYLRKEELLDTGGEPMVEVLFLQWLHGHRCAACWSQLSILCSLHRPSVNTKVDVECVLKARLTTESGLNTTDNKNVMVSHCLQLKRRN